MLQSLPFLAGLIAGAAVVGALRGERARGAMNDAGTRLRAAYDDVQRGARAAAQSGFDLVRGVGAKREAPADASPAPAEAAQAAAKPARKAAAPRKPAAAKAASAPAAAAKPKRASRKPKPAEA